MQLKQDNTLLKYNNTYHDTIKLKTVDVNPNTYIDYNEEKNDKAPKFEIGDHVRILKHKSISAKKNTLQICLQKFWGLKKLKAVCLGHMLLVIVMGKKLLEYLRIKIAKNKSKRIQTRKIT